MASSPNLPTNVIIRPKLWDLSENTFLKKFKCIREYLHETMCDSWLSELECVFPKYNQK